MNIVWVRAFGQKVKEVVDCLTLPDWNFSHKNILLTFMNFIGLLVTLIIIIAFAHTYFFFKMKDVLQVLNIISHKKPKWKFVCALYLSFLSRRCIKRRYYAKVHLFLAFILSSSTFSISNSPQILAKLYNIHSIICTVFLCSNNKNFCWWIFAFINVGVGNTFATSSFQNISDKITTLTLKARSCLLNWEKCFQEDDYLVVLL